jgi:hypothetical protein
MSIIFCNFARFFEYKVHEKNYTGISFGAVMRRADVGTGGV